MKLSDEAREAARAAASDVLADTYDCVRCWTAWGIRTMGPDDFESIWDNTERLDQIVDAVVEAINKASTASGERSREEAA